jgi:3',5'-cyclic AMP phosphodiesterase CpdA
MIRPTLVTLVTLATLLALAACTRPGEDRALRDQDIGRASAAGVDVEFAGGLAHERTLGPGELTLWAQAPVLDVTIDLAAAATFIVTVDNALADLQLATAAASAPLPPVRDTLRAWAVELPAGRTALTIAPPDAADLTPWSFAVMGDIQAAMPTVHEVFARISAEPGPRFVLSTGDVVDRGREDEYVMFEEQLAALDLPFYSTIGNHELWGDIDRWYTRFGRATVHFDFRGVAFSLVDSASAGIDPTTGAQLDAWLDEHAADLHIFATHYPPLDPIGVRQGSFASRREAQTLLARLAATSVDLTLYGHLHTYTSFTNAGIPAHVSGGGGADPMAFDGIDRHFLVVSVDPTAGRVTSVRVVRVD